MLFPSLDTAYYTEDDRTVQQMLDYYYQQAIQINQSFWSEADIDSRFKAGDQTLWNDIYGNLPAFRRRQFNFNRIRRIVNMITGYQRQHRLSSIVVPVENSDQDTADQLSKVLIWANNNSNLLNILSDAFEGAVTTGMNLVSVWMDYRSDPINGDIRCDNVSYNEYLIDPFFKKKDLSDCRFVWTRKWLSKREAKSIMPSRADEIDAMHARGWRDGKFQFQPEAYNYAMQDLLSYDEFWYLDYRTQKLLVDVDSGQTMEWQGDEATYRAFKKYYPQITTVDQEVPTCKLATCLNGRAMYNGPNPMGIDRYPFVPVLAYYDPQIPYFPYRVQGVVRGLRDAQYLYNRRKIIELDIFESQINSGIKYKEDSLINPKDAFLTGQGRALALKKEANMDDVQQIMPPQVPPSMIQLSEILGNEIQEISGVNEELLGSAQDDKAGILSMLRQGAGLTTLQVLFDQLNFSQIQLGQIYIDLIQKNFSPGKVRRIIAEEPTEQFYTRSFQKYDCDVQEGMYSTTQKQMQFAQLLHLREIGIPVPSSVLVEASTLQDKKKLIQAIEAQEQQQQQQMQMAEQIGLQEQAAKIESLHAKAKADEGMAAERYARIQENKALAVERLAEAEKDRSLGVYHELKAIKELEQLDINQIVSFLDILKRMKEQSRLEEDIEKSSLEQQEAVEKMAVSS